MKLSIETTIGGAVALAFAVVSMAVMAPQEQGRKIPTNNYVLNQISARSFTGSSSVALTAASESPFLAQY